MLSLSAELSQQDVDLQVVNGSGDGGVPFGTELREFAEALASRDGAALDTARETLLRAAGTAVLVDAAGVAANFQRMVRIADSTGIPVDSLMNALSGSIQDDLDLRRFDSAANTPPASALRRLLARPMRYLAMRAVRAAGRRAQG